MSEIPPLSPEAAASIPAENERRARLYDKLWELAYHEGTVRLAVVGGHVPDYWVTIKDRPGVRGDLATVEAWIADQNPGREGQ